jgi:hypothetical protein
MPPPTRPDPIPCPVCGADIDPTLIDNECKLFGTDPQKILEAIPQWGCFAIPGWNHSTWTWPEAAEIAKGIYVRVNRPIDLLAIQHAWSLLRPTVNPTYAPYTWVPERLREKSLHPVTR